MLVGQTGKQARVKRVLKELKEECKRDTCVATTPEKKNNKYYFYGIDSSPLILGEYQGHQGNCWKPGHTRVHSYHPVTVKVEENGEPVTPMQHHRV